MRLCVTGVAGYTWVAVLHLWWGFSFRTTLMLANITSVAWLFIYHAVLPPRKLEAVSQLHTLTSRSSSVTSLPNSARDASDGIEAAALQEQQGHLRQIEDAEVQKVQPPPPNCPPPPSSHLSSCLLIPLPHTLCTSPPLCWPSGSVKNRPHADFVGSMYLRL